MDIKIVKSVIDKILENCETFDSHVFIRAFIKTQPSSYGKMLIEYDDVTVTHSVIANFLLNNAKDLEIERLDSDSTSRDIFDIETPCAAWMVTTKD